MDQTDAIKVPSASRTETREQSAALGCWFKS